LLINPETGLSADSILENQIEDHAVKKKKKIADSEQLELLLAFVEEGKEMLDNSEPLLIELEAKANQSGKVDTEVLNTIFRLFHSLKGGAGFLDLKTVGRLTHEAETLLDLFRKGKGQIKSLHIDLLTQTCDFLHQLLNNIQSRFTDEGFDDEAAVLIEQLHVEIESITNESNVAVTIASESASNNAGSDAAVANESLPDALQVIITPEMIKQFASEAEDLLGATEEAFLILDKEPASQQHIDDAFRSLHSFKGNAGFFGYGDLERLSHQAETVLDKIRTGEISGTSELFSLLLNVVDFLREGVALLSQGREPIIPALPGLINLVHDALKKIGKSNSKSATKAIKEKSEATAKPRSANQASEKVVDAEALRPETAKGDSVDSAARQSIRVDVDKLESLLDLVGELVIAEAMVVQNPDLQGVGVALERFEKSALHLNKIVRDLQEMTTSIRMIPLSTTFKRMIRLVRDLGQKTGKKIELQISGEETEVDKTVIEKITDPLVHIIRNSIDHGIGTPEQRREQGKSETGQVNLSARHAGGEVWISVTDDGNGLRRDKILAKAIEKGLVTGDGTTLSDEEVWQLIFLPGFSTADKITEVSGRGVGMDVVRRNIENIRGKVEVFSKAGEGTGVTLRIPLTLAIIDGMIIRVGENRYILPIVAIKETLRVGYDGITTTMDGQEVIKVRDKLHGVARLHAIYNVQPSNTELPHGIIVMVENSNKCFGLFVDELIGQHQVVIKGLSEYIGKLKGISGCTILGDGTVCLILDIAGLAEIVESGAGASAWAHENAETEINNSRTE
jgi:two-component system chemotaxis sensor kinase CheA